MPRVPDPYALRRDRPDDPEWTRLTPRDADAVVPDFPLASPTPRDLHWWQDAWAKPQANEWAKNEEHAAVAMYCRLMARSEMPNSHVTLLRPLQQLREELGISVTGLRRRRWLMPKVADPERPSHAAAPRHGRPSARDRFGRSSVRDNFRIVPTAVPKENPA